MASDPPTESVAVTIHGKTFTFAVSPGQTADQVRRAAQLLDEKMRAAGDESAGQAFVQTAISASLNLVDELFRLQSEYEAAETDIAERTSRLSDSLHRLLEASETTESRPLPASHPAENESVESTSQADDRSSDQS